VAAAARNRVASHRGMLGTPHADYSVAVKVRSTETVTRGGPTHGSPDDRRRRVHRQTDAVQLEARARVHQVTSLCPGHQCGVERNKKTGAHDDSSSGRPPRL